MLVVIHIIIFFLLVNHLLDKLFVIDLIRILRKPIINLSPHLVISAIEYKVTLRQTSGHPANLLYAPPIILPLLVIFNQRLFMLDQQLHLLDVIKLLPIIHSLFLLPYSFFLYFLVFQLLIQ